MSDITLVKDPEHIARLRSDVFRCLHEAAVEYDPIRVPELLKRKHIRRLDATTLVNVQVASSCVIPAPEGKRVLLYVTPDGSFLVDEPFDCYRLTCTAYEQALDCKEKGCSLFEARLVGSKRTKDLHISAIDCAMFRNKCMLSSPLSQRLACTRELQRKLQSAHTQMAHFIPYRMPPIYQLTHFSQLLLDKKTDSKGNTWQLGNLYVPALHFMDETDDFHFSRKHIYEWKVNDSSLSLQTLSRHILMTEMPKKRKLTDDDQTKSQKKARATVDIVDHLATHALSVWKHSDQDESKNTWRMSLRVLPGSGPLTGAAFEQIIRSSGERIGENILDVKSGIVLHEYTYLLEENVELYHTHCPAEQTYTYSLSGTVYTFECDVQDVAQKFQLHLVCTNHPRCSSDFVQKREPYSVSHVVRTTTTLREFDCQLHASVVGRGLTLGEAKKAPKEYQLELEILRSATNMKKTEQELAQALVCTAFETLGLSMLTTRCTITNSSFPQKQEAKESVLTPTGHRVPKMKKRFDNVY